MSQKRNKKGHPALRVFVKTLLVILLIGGGLLAAFRYVRPLKKAVVNEVVKEAAQEAVVSSGGYISEEQVQQALNSMSSDDREKLETILDDHADPSTISRIGSYVASGDYNSAYDKSYASAAAYLEKYPSISFILDIHRDAISDADGNQYKVVSQEDPHAAQLSIIMGSNYDAWLSNLRLAAAVQSHLLEKHPTLMRPITLRWYGYNQSLSPGSLLVEIGAAGNSLDEAIYSARLFAQGFAETLGCTKSGG